MRCSIERGSDLAFGNGSRQARRDAFLTAGSSRPWVCREVSRFSQASLRGPSPRAREARCARPGDRAPGYAGVAALLFVAPPPPPPPGPRPFPGSGVQGGGGVQPLLLGAQRPLVTGMVLSTRRARAGARTIPFGVEHSRGSRAGSLATRVALNDDNRGSCTCRHGDGSQSWRS